MFFDVKPKIVECSLVDVEPEAKKLKTDQTNNNEKSDADTITEAECSNNSIQEEEMKHETSRPSRLSVNVNKTPQWMRN